MNAAYRKQTAIDIAKMYYINGESQDQIAAATGMSRSNISRILKKCVDDGIVEIVVHDNISKRPELGHKLCGAFGLKDAIIVPSDSSEERVARHAGERVALYLESILQDNMLLGVGRGRACYYTGRNLKNEYNLHVDVIQMLGAASSTASLEESNGLISLFVSKLNGTGYVLNAPLMVRSKRTKQELLDNALLHNTMKRYQDIDVAIFEVSQPDLYARNLSRQEWLTKADLLQLSEVRVVSCVCGYYFDQNGHSCNAGINDRILAISQEQLRKIPYSIGILTGKNTLPSALSVMRSGLINVLVVDESLALRLESYIDDLPEDT